MMDFQALIDMALAEDIGTGDITTCMLVPEDVQARMILHAQQPLIMAAGAVAAQVFHTLEPVLNVHVRVGDGMRAQRGEALLHIDGPAQALLTAERTALNILQHACGIATLTRAYVDAVAGTKTVILDTRKTLPGLRALEKYAVACGGGQNHRMGLYDMVLIKDNHLEIRHENIGSIVKKARTLTHVSVVVECDTLTQVEEVLAAQPDRILLDNMDNETLKAAVALSAGRVPLEASGGVSLDTVRGIAETGVDYISVGKLTHSAPAADISAEITLSA